MKRPPSRFKRSIARRYRLHVSEPFQYSMALIRWRKRNFQDSPIVFGNAMPKSGSKLLLQILQGISKSGPFAYVNPSGIRTNTIQGHVRSDVEIAEDLQNMVPGIIRYGYLHATPENIAFLCRSNWVTFFIYRDPRDMLISEIFYALDIHEGHRLRNYLLRLPNMDERIKATIQGVNEDVYHHPDVRRHYNHFLGWLNQPEVMSIRFEDIINQQEKALTGLLEHFERRGYALPTEKEKALQNIKEAIQPKRSSTFRKGKTGDWKNYFNEENKKIFKDVAGDLLIQLGYEKDNNW